jgi:hypothetical protein
MLAEKDELENKRQRVNELLTNWSKWLITINMFAATGCVVGLKTAGESTEKTGIYFFAAILSFGLSIVCATLFVFLIARHSLKKIEKNATPFLWLAKMQWILFTMGLSFVLTWIGFLSKVF